MELAKTQTPKTKIFKPNNKPIIVLMTKWHSIYRCKSRLSKEIGAHKASKIQEKLTNHTIKVVKEVEKEGIDGRKLVNKARKLIKKYEE